MRFHPPLRQQAISVCWSNGATVIVHKPAGVATQELPALLNAQLGREAGAPVWLPHRIDKFTRGLQVVTLSKATCSALNRSSEQRRWRKEYRALACLPRDAAARRRSPLFGCDGKFLSVPDDFLRLGRRGFKNLDLVLGGSPALTNFPISRM